MEKSSMGKFKICVFISLLIFILYNPVLETAVSLKNSTRYALSYFFVFYANIETPNSGLKEIIVPPEVKEMITLIHKHKIRGFQLSRQLQQNGGVLQRITEMAWPVKIEVGADYCFRLVGEVEPRKLEKEIERMKEVVLVYCHL